MPRILYSLPGGCRRLLLAPALASWAQQHRTGRVCPGRQGSPRATDKCPGMPARVNTKKQRQHRTRQTDDIIMSSNSRLYQYSTLLVLEEPVISVRRPGEGDAEPNHLRKQQQYEERRREGEKGKGKGKGRDSAEFIIFRGWSAVYSYQYSEPQLSGAIQKESHRERSSVVRGAVSRRMFLSW